MSEADLQRLLAMQTGGFSLMDPAAALHAFGGLGGGLPLQGLPPVMLPGSMPGSKQMCVNTLCQGCNLHTRSHMWFFHSLTAALRSLGKSLLHTGEKAGVGHRF